MLTHFLIPLFTVWIKKWIKLQASLCNKNEHFEKSWRTNRHHKHHHKTQMDGFLFRGIFNNACFDNCFLIPRCESRYQKEVIYYRCSNKTHNKIHRNKYESVLIKNRPKHWIWYFLCEKQLCRIKCSVSIRTGVTPSRGLLQNIFCFKAWHLWLVFVRCD